MRDVRGEVWWDGAMWCAVGNDVDAEDDNDETNEGHDDAYDYVNDDDGAAAIADGIDDDETDADGGGAVCIVLSGPFWTRGWPEWWGWWLNLPIWR